MGFHICEYCPKGVRPATSSGDVFLTFTNGHSYVMPDMIVHYVQMHVYQPPQAFVDDVMSGALLYGERAQTKSLPVQVGYLSGDYPCGETPHLFVYVLAGMMTLAAEQGERRQTRGVISPLTGEPYDPEWGTHRR